MLFASARCAAFLLLALCLTGADCGGGETPGTLEPGDVFECSKVEKGHFEQASGDFEVGVNGSAVGPWRLGIFVAPREGGTYDVWLSSCVLIDGVETWRQASIAHLQGPVKGAPVRLPVPASSAPGYSGGLLDVVGNREHHFLLRGAGTLEVQEFDPDARRFIARGEVYPEQGGTVTLSWDLKW